MDLQKLAKRLVPLIVDNPASPPSQSMIELEYEIGDYDLVISDVVQAAHYDKIQLPDELLVEIGSHLDLLRAQDCTVEYVMLLERAGLPVSEALAASAAEEREEIARINPGWQY